MSAHTRQRALRRRLHVAQVLLIAIVLAGTAYVADTVVGGRVFHDPYEVTLHLDEAGGLHARSVVTYRGQRIGVVDDVQLDADGVVARVSIDEGVQVPRESDFEVRNLSAVGEQYLDIRPRVDDGPWLEDGTVIGADEATTPLPTHQVLAETQRLMRRIDLRDVRTIARETGVIFADGSVDLRATGIELERTVALLQRLEPDLVRLVQGAQVPLRTGVAIGADVRSSVRDLGAVAETLRTANPTIRRLIDDGSRALPDVLRLWQDLNPVAAELLRDAAPLMTMSREHLPGLEVWLDWGPRQADAMAGSTRDGTGHVVLVPKSLKNCSYTEDRRGPFDLDDVPIDLDRRCTTVAPGIQHRGSQNVPVP